MNESYQHTFSSTIIDLIWQGYSSGVMQQYPIVIAGITATMAIYTHFNTLTVELNGVTLTTSIWDSDNESTQYSTVQNLIADIIAK